MLRQGPIPRFAHGLVEYLEGSVFVAAPFVLDFEAGAAVAVSIVVGVLVLVVAATTEGPTSLVNSLQVQLHVLLDYALAAFLIAAPFLFAFSDESAPTAFFIVLGVGHLMMTVARASFARASGRGASGPLASRRPRVPARSATKAACAHPTVGLY